MARFNIFAFIVIVANAIAMVSNIYIYLTHINKKNDNRNYTIDALLGLLNLLIILAYLRYYYG